MRCCCLAGQRLIPLLNSMFVVVPRCRRLAELAGSVAAAEEAPEPLALLDQIRRLVDPCFSAMLAYSTRRSRQQPAAGTPAAAADGEATSAPVAAAAAAGGGRPPLPPQQDLLTLDCMRSLLLQQVPAAVADLRRQHVEAAEPQQRRQLARRLLLELYLRLSICAYGEITVSRGLRGGLRRHMHACTQ